MSADALWLAGLEDRARAVLPAPVFEYVVQGAREGWTAERAVDAWRAVPLLPRVLGGVTHVDPSVSVLDHDLAVPWGVAPTTLQRAVHPDGELAMARATAASQGLLVVSSNAGTPFDTIGATGVHWWVQCYLPAERDLAVPLLQRALAAGARGVVLTVDTPVVATKYAVSDAVWDVVDPALLGVNFDPGYDQTPGAEKATDLGPADIAWIAEVSGLPVVVKGVLRADDALRCLDAGAAGIWVSNHGGRQLDRAATTASALPAVSSAVVGRGEVYVDGGLRSGLDVLTALALGADAVFLGRLPLYALTEGEAGVSRMHRELLAQTVEAMRLSGSPTVSATRAMVVP